MIDQLITNHTILPTLLTKRRSHFFGLALAERRNRLLTENTQGLPTAFCMEIAS